MKWLQIVFSLSYILLLNYLVFFARRRKHLTDRISNFLPIRNLYDDYTKLEVSHAHESFNFYSNLLGNIFLFIPLPFVLRWLFKINKVIDLLYWCLAISVGIEFIQYIGKVGVADIDDIILNITGALIAIPCLRWVRRRRAVTATKK